MTKAYTYNYRFGILIELIRKKILLDEISQEELLDIAERTFGGYDSQQDIRLFLEHKKDLEKGEFELFCNLLDTLGGIPVNQIFIDFGFGNPFDEFNKHLPTNGKIIELWQKSVVITRYSAVASGSMNVDPIVVEPKSWLNKIDAIIEVIGDSMADKVFEGDELFCNKLDIERTPLFKNDKTIYVLEVKGYGNAMIKYVEHKKGNSFVTLVSENQAHKPFNIEIEDITSIFEVIKVVKNPKTL